MLGQYLGELAALIGFEQQDIAVRLRMNKSAVNRWFKGVRQIPEEKRAHVAAIVLRAAEIFLEHYDEGGMFPISWEPGPEDERNRKSVPLVKRLMARCEKALLEERAEGLDALLDAALVVFAKFRDMPPAERRKAANAAQVEALASDLAQYAALLKRLGTLQEQEK